METGQAEAEMGLKRGEITGMDCNGTYVVLLSPTSFPPTRMIILSYVC
jgi:hypothetical protein